MINTDREALYQQAMDLVLSQRNGSFKADVRAVVDLVLDVQTGPTDPVEDAAKALRAASTVVLRHGYDPTSLMTVLDVADYLTGQAGRLESEHRAAQEKAAAEAAREKLIEQAAREIEGFFGTTAAARNVARTLAEVGLLAAPETTDGGAK